MFIKDKVEATLRQVAVSLRITNYDLDLDETALRGDGFLSESYTGSVRNKDTGKVTEVYIKYPPQKKIEVKHDVFENEYRYYSIIYPELQRFQKEKSVKEPFDKVPVFYCGDIELGADNIVLENLSLQDYHLWDKNKFLDENHLNAIFNTYGKYHALTFGFKDQNPEKNAEILKGLHNIFEWAFDVMKPEVIKYLLQNAFEDIQKLDEKKAARLIPLLDDIKSFTHKRLYYEGNYSALTHGDCWSNNMMFKYDKNGKVKNLRLLDFQIIRESTPVHDLSYFFYAGASKKDFEKLDSYLEIYYKSFCSFASELGSDPTKLLPFDVLKTDWKKYALFGINFGLVAWRGKLISKEEIAGFDDGNNFANMEATLRKVAETEVYRNIAKDIVLHAIEYGII